MPIPRLRKSSPLYRRVCDDYGTLSAQLAAEAPNDFVGGRLAVLQAHYWQPDLRPEVAREVASDYIRLLRGFPAKVWADTHDKVLKDPERKFYPKLGELELALQCTHAILKYRALKLKRLVEAAVE